LRLALLLFSAMLYGQGMASRGAASMPRPKASGRVFPVSFRDTALLRTPQISGGVVPRYIIEAMGSGVAFLDYDNDGWLDVFLAGGTRFGGAPGASNRLYRNDGKGGFVDVTVKAGLLREGWGQSVAVADYDNDGYADIFVTYWGKNALYRNHGDGTFHEVLLDPSVERRWGSGASFVDYDRDGFVDLFVANYLTFDPAKTPPPGRDKNCQWLGAPVFCGPRGLPFATNLLYRNNGDGTFKDVSAASGIGTPMQTYALGVLAADMDGDDWPDIYVASDSSRSLFYHNNHDGTFTERATYVGLGFDENGLEQAGMGVALGDYDGDGLLDIAKTNFADDYPNLYRSIGKAGFTDRALHAGLGVNPQYVLWSAVFADFDNDTWPDLFLAAGHVFAGPSEKNPQLLYWNLGNGKFEDVSASIRGLHSSRGAAAGDFDNDGVVDLLIMNRNEPPSLLRATSTSGNNWIKIHLRGTVSNRMAIGAKVRVLVNGRWQTQVVLSQSGYYSVNDPRLHFGLGKAGGAEAVEVTWPNGGVGKFGAQRAGQVLKLTERAQ
jgi:hypothetical protein